MNILDKQSPNGTGSGSAACAQSSSVQPPSVQGGPMTPSSADCLLGSSSALMPSSLSAPPPPPSSVGPSSVSSSSAPHTPLDSLNSTVNCQQQQQLQQQQQPPDLISNNGLSSTRPNVSTPSSVFNSSAPNTPMPCSVGSDAPITSPAINHQLEMYNSGGGVGGPVGPPPPPSQVLPGNNNNLSNAVMSPSPLNVPPPLCSNDNTANISGNNGGGGGGKKGAMSNGTGSNKKHCNNRNQNNNNNSNNSNSNFANMSVKCENNAAVNVAKNHMNFPPPNSNMACGMPNGAHNGSNSPFDADHKMGSFIKSEFINDFGQPISNEMIPPPVGNMPRPPMNCGVALPMQQQQHQQPMQQQQQSQQPGNLNAPPGKMCPSNMPPNHGLMKPPPMDQQYMQCQSQIFVFNTHMVNQAAEAVDSGNFHSIIGFHLANPHTKSFIEKNNLKLPIQNKPNNLWQGNIRPPRMRGPNPNGMCGIRGPNNFNSNPCYPYNHNPPGPGPGGGGPQWSGPNNWPGQPGPPFSPNDMNNMNKMANCNPRPYGPQYNGSAPYPLDMQDLTPQQKQHREKQLAKLASIRQNFLPELELGLNNRPLSQPPQPNEFPGMDEMGNPMPPLLPESDPMNPMLPSDSYNPSFPPNPMMPNQSGGGGPDQWAKGGGPFVDEKPPPPFNGRRKGSQGGSQVGNQMGQHQSPLSQQSMNSPSSCVTSSPGTRVPPPPYNTGLRTMPSPHPASPAATSLSLPSPRMHPNDTRQQSFTPGGVRSGPATPASADTVNCGQLINSPKSSSRPSNTSPGSSASNKKAKSSSLENDLALMNASFPPKSESAQLMPVPSPKQIDYNNFDGHELVIHKQPNAHFQDNELLNSGELGNDLYSNDFMNICSSVNSSGAPPNMPDMNSNHRFPPNSCNYDSNPKFPPPDPSHRYSNNNGFAIDGYGRPSPNSCPPPPFNQNEAMRYSNCDPAKNRINSPADIAFSAANSMDMNMMTNSMPPISTEGPPPFSNGQSHSFGDHPDGAIGSSHLQNLQKMTPPFDKDGMMATSKSGMPPNMVNTSSGHMVPNSMHPNIPQNPNHRMPNFDPSFPPCNDMGEPNSFGPGPGMHPPNMPPMGGYSNNQFTNSPRMPSNEPPFGMHPGSQFPGNMPMNGPPGEPPGGMNGPMMMPGGGPPPPPPPQQQQPQPPNARFPGNGIRPTMNPSNTHSTRYNSPNIQVKPDAPNTIQYLPSRPQGPTSTPPSRPPNLDFLQQSLSMGGKASGGQPLPPPPPPQQGMPPGAGNNGPYFGPNGPGPGGPMGMPPRGPPPPMQGHMNFNRAPMMQRPHPNMQNGPPGMGPGLQMGPQGGGGGGPPPLDMYNRPPGANSMVNGPGSMPGGPPGPPNFGGPPGGKAGGPMGMGHPGEGNQSFNSFKPSFPNPTSDPAYAAQFHNFQQQLYATNTRNSASNPRMTSNF